VKNRRLTALVVPALVALVAAACGSSSNGSSSATTASGGGGAATTAASGGAATTAAAGGSATTAAAGGAATGEPIVFGLANMDTGAVSFPGAGSAAQAAAKYINDTLGGINGRPLQFVACDMKNDPQAAAACGQQFANDSKADGVLLTLAVNAGPLYNALQSSGKPIIGGYGISPADNAPPNTYFYYAGAVFYPALADWIKSQPDIHTIAYLHGPDAASQGGADALKKILGSSYDIKEQIVAPGTADLTPAIQASGAANADLLLAFPTGSGGPLAQALHDVGAKPKKILSLESIVTPQELQKSPDLYTGWILANPAKIAAADPNDPDTKQFLDAVGGEANVQPFGEVGWGTTMSLYNVLKSVPADQLNPQGIAAAIKDYKGPVVMGPKTISCPGDAPTTATCTKGLIFYNVQPGGKLAQANS
jgi:branched-chain amino acid transport system substrate-binding protein